MSSVMMNINILIKNNNICNMLTLYKISKSYRYFIFRLNIVVIFIT